MTAWTQLFLLVCMIALSASQSCDEITCCSGLVCIEQSFGISEMKKAKCVKATSCDQLDCPSGYVCVRKSQGSGRSSVSCQASCADVRCPEFLQCVEKFSGTECVIPNECSLVKCPPGTSCQIQEKERQMEAVCLGESCNSVTCFEGSDCFDSTLLKPVQFFRRESRSNSGEIKSKTDASGDVSSQAKCLPTCEGADICPQGLVCDTDGYELVCREPRSCSEIECPMGQECQEVRCEYGHANRRKRSDTMTNTRIRANILVQCVDIDLASGSGMDTSAITAPTETNPTVLILE